MAQTLGLQGRCPLRFSPRTASGGPGFRPAYWAHGPNARPPGALPPPFFAPDRQRRAGVPAGLLGPWPKRSASRGVAPSVFRPGPSTAGRGSGRLIGPVAQTLGLQGRCPLRFSPRTANGGPGAGRLIGPVAQTLGLLGRCPLRRRTRRRWDGLKPQRNEGFPTIESGRRS